jgi:flagellar biosynthetic protein FlhB
MGRALAWPLEISFAVSAVMMTAAVVGASAQDGMVFNFAKLTPDLSRLNPISYFGRIFSSTGALELLKSAIKIVVIIWVAWKSARWGLDMAAAAHDLTEELYALATASRRMLYISATLAIVTAAADYAHKRYEHETNLRMTRQEFLDQLKSDEGNPLVKRAIRKAQRKRRSKRVAGIHQAATATVVLTNPTHFAVALRYRRGFDSAPLVVAKGAGENAQRIKEIARLAAVPVMENKALAQALFKSVEVGDLIPRQFYRAIAEVLATIMRADAKRETAYAQREEAEAQHEPEGVA